MKNIITALGLVFISIVLILFAVSFGAVKFSPDTIMAVFSGIFTGETVEGLQKAQLILFRLRLPRVLLAAIAGAGLGISGAVFQGVFRNPLAEPYLLGVSSGAALGASLAMVMTVDLFAGTVSGIGSITIAAFLGAIVSTLLVFFLAGGMNRDFSFLLLAGIALSYIFQALISFIMMMNRNELERIVFWMMGSFSTASWSKVIVSGFLVLGMSVILLINSGRLNILSLGRQEAFSLGVDSRKTGLFLLSISSLITASVISVTGIIGFVGLLIPHIVRHLTGPDHRKVLPYSALAGAVLLVYADLAARALIPPKEIPVGVITAMLGGPFFLVQLKLKGWRRGL